MKNYWITLVLLLCISCNFSDASKRGKKQITGAEFIGTWVYVTSSHESDGRTNDHSMQRSMMKILREENSRETYIGRLNSHRDMIFTRNGNTLEGVNVRLRVVYNDSSQHIIIYYDTSWQEFKKLP